MAFDGSSLDDYIDVAERISVFHEKYPEGTLQCASLEFREFGGKSWVVYTAAAYRSPEDPTPGIGTAWEQVPGRTPYTRDSEVQNAETAAWGRAIVALGLPASTRIASRQEVQARQQDRLAEEARESTIRAIAHRSPGVEPEELKRRVGEFLGKPVEEADADDLQRYLDTLPVATEDQAKVDRAMPPAKKGR